MNVVRKPINDVLWVRISKGTVGCLIHFFSTTRNAAIAARPTMSGTRTWTEPQA